MITDPRIENYFYNLLPLRDPILAEMEEQARQRNIPIIGPAVATLLAQLVRVSGARRIFELGSAIGYSTIWLARAAGPDAEIHYSDGSPENAKEAQGYFERAGVASQIQVHVGDALSELAKTAGKFDFIFNDVDKEGYPAVLDVVPLRLSTGGIFVTDNTLWHGAVLDPADQAAQAVVDFNRKLFESKNFVTSLIPVRDGVSISLKVS
jgi:caffeoyl-CoA O-methyltransferase